jgi:F0F1-type ATP synthase delta subunit
MTSRAENYANALLDSWDEAELHERGHVIDRFIELLRADRVLPLVPNIISAVEVLTAEKIKRQTITVEFAHKPTGQQLEALKRLEVTQTSESPAVIGGFRIQGRHKIIDASVKGGLRQMRQALALE